VARENWFSKTSLSKQGFESPYGFEQTETYQEIKQKNIDISPYKAHG
jgi:hypothetical protein